MTGFFKHFKMNFLLIKKSSKRKRKENKTFLLSILTEIGQNNGHIKKLLTRQCKVSIDSSLLAMVTGCNR